MASTDNGFRHGLFPLPIFLPQYENPVLILNYLKVVIVLFEVSRSVGSPTINRIPLSDNHGWVQGEDEPINCRIN